MPCAGGSESSVRQAAGECEVKTGLKVQGAGCKV